MSNLINWENLIYFTVLNCDQRVGNFLSFIKLCSLRIKHFKNLKTLSSCWVGEWKPNPIGVAKQWNYNSLYMNQAHKQRSVVKGSEKHYTRTIPCSGHCKMHFNYNGNEEKRVFHLDKWFASSLSALFPLLLENWNLSQWNISSMPFSRREGWGERDKI